MSRVRVFFVILALFGITFLGAGCKPGEPLAGFTTDPTSGTAPLKVQFTDASVITKESTITGWAWDFGDGGTSTDQDPEHTYTAAGSYAVSLTVTSSNRKTNTATVSNCVTVTLTAVPNVVGLAQSAAEAAIVGAGLQVGTVTEEHHSTVPAGNVSSQDPTSGTGVLRGSAVNLIVSKGPFVIETLTILLPGDVPLELVKLPAGTFQMGSPDTERGRGSSEGPVHTVNIGYDFYMGKYEVTQGQWLAVMGSWPGDDPSSTYGAGTDYPAYNVSWDDAQTFITALNAHITARGQGPATLRLPSESEWEYACRAGTRTRFYFGDSLGVGDMCEDDGVRSQHMWYCGNRGIYREAGYGTKPVGGLLPNGFGLYDMIGNVYEWCEDWWHSNYTGAPADGSAWVDPSALGPVPRGGYWDSSAPACRSAARGYTSPSSRGLNFGFRLAADDAGPIIPVPDVTGMTRAEAEAAIVGAGLVVGTVTQRSSDTVSSGSVIRQNLASGTGVLLGSAVSLVVSSGPFVGETVAIFLPGNVPLELVKVPAGSFQMGSPASERGRGSSEGPVHTVNIGYDFYMGKYEVTQGQWMAVMGASPGGGTWGYGEGSNFPANVVSWDNAQAFISAVNAYIMATGQGSATLRLPSEGEWEYACRAGTQTRFYFGASLGVADECEDDGVRSQYMWYCNNTYYGGKPVGGKLPNGFGLYDMSGNVSEWCEDWWHSNYTGAPTDGSAWTSPSASDRVVRGGDWGDDAQNCRSADRGSHAPSARYSTLGFRLAADDMGPMVPVPDVTGMTLAEVEAAIVGAGLVVGTMTERYHETVPAGNVISQNPAAGTRVAPGIAVSLVVSSGPFVGETVAILLPGNVPLELVRIPAGSFQMGSPNTERGRGSDEGPVHTVTIGYDFYMGKYEVTRGQWLAVMGSRPGLAPGGAGSDYPAYDVSWNDAQAFITALNAHITATGQGPATLRLPSESEWEYACREGSQTRFYFGDSLGMEDTCEDDGVRSQYMWYCGNNPRPSDAPGYGRKPVGGKLPNGFGLYDMSGNVSEWCEDWWDSDYTGAPADGSAWTSPSAWYRVIRGGYWSDDARYCRSAARGYTSPSSRGSTIGFRLAADDAGPIIPVPDVTGMTLAEAEAAIVGAGLVVGPVTEQSSATVPAGNVISQNPAAGTSVAPGIAVSLVVSSGPWGGGGDTETILLPGDVPLELVKVPAGSFQMGSPDTERGRWDNEGPVHTVAIGYDFYMGKYEVTQGQWLAVMGSWPDTAPSSTYGVGANYPAYNVSWEDAQAFITALNAHITATGQGAATLRLPSESEWEYACRAGTQTRFHFGDSLGVDDYCEDDGERSQYMWYCGNNADYGESGYGPKPVGGKLPNGCGLYDMSGNLWEWCEDWWHWDYTGAPTDGSAWILNPTASRRVFRGGGWTNYAQNCRSARRYDSTPSYRSGSVGFRLASVR